MRIITDERCTGYWHPGHPERPERIITTCAGLRRQTELPIIWSKPGPGDDAAILRAHTAEHLARLSQAEDFDLCMSATGPWLDYLATLKAIQPSLLSPQESFRQAIRCFASAAQDASGAEAGTPSLFLKAHASLIELETLLDPGGAGRQLWDLLRGPLDHTLDFSLGQSAGVLQEAWTETVLGPLRETRGEGYRKLLFGQPDGKVWAFLAGPARPFVLQKGGQYVPRAAFNGQTLPLRPGFFTFLRSGQESALAFQPSFSVNLETLPLEVNAGARTRPTGCSLCLQTPDSRTCLENFNYRQSARFKWEPGGIGETTLQIQLPQLTLSRSYPEAMGFGQFLKEFESGSHVFTARDFPEAEGQLQELGITAIRVAYRIQGAAPALRFLRMPPAVVPEHIVADPEALEAAGTGDTPAELRGRSRP